MSGPRELSDKPLATILHADLQRKNVLVTSSAGYETLTSYTWLKSARPEMIVPGMLCKSSACVLANVAYTVP